MKTSRAQGCLWYCGVLGVVSFVVLVLCTMKNGVEDVELIVPDLADRIVTNIGREAPIAAGSSLQRMSRKKRYVAFPEGSSLSVRCLLTSKHRWQKHLILGGLLYDDRFRWQSAFELLYMVDELGRGLRLAQRNMGPQFAATKATTHS